MNKFKQHDVIEALLRKFNPFGLRTKNGVPMEFLRLSEVYLYVMNTIYSSFPKGYIEVPLAIRRLYNHLSFNECKRTCEAMKPMGIEPITCIDYELKEARDFFERFCRALHKICETEFDAANFQEATRLFRNRMELFKLKQKEETDKLF